MPTKYKLTVDLKRCTNRISVFCWFKYYLEVL